MMRIVLLVAVLAGAGCVEVDDELTLNADGSGTVTIRTTVLVARARLQPMWYFWGHRNAAHYPPVVEEDARALFPADAFTVKTKPVKGKDDAWGLEVTAAFKDVASLLKSPYGRVHRLWMRKSGGTFTLKARSGAEDAVRIEAEAGDWGAVPAAGEDQGKLRDRMRYAFSVKLPAKVAAEQAKVSGDKATWTLARAELKEPPKFAAALNRVMTATCAAEAVKFDPPKTKGLGVLNYDEIVEGPLADQPAAVDVKGVQAAAKFVPLMVRVKRTFDFAGMGGVDRPGAWVLVACVLPDDLAPQRWTDATLTEAVDDQGHGLLVAGERDRRYADYGVASAMQAADKPGRHLVKLDVKVPPIGAKALGRLAGSITAVYPGVDRLVKLKDAVKKGDIDRRSVYMDRETPGLQNAALTQLGLSLRGLNGYEMQGATQVRFEIVGDAAVVTDVQVYDASGRPWSTGFEAPRPGETRAGITIAGKPEPPLSLVLKVNGGGPAVKLPFVLKDLPLQGGKVPEFKEPAREAPQMPPDVPVID